jgi:hypothetical protein
MLALTPQISQFALENLSKNIEVRLLGFAFSNTKRGNFMLEMAASCATSAIPV